MKDLFGKRPDDEKWGSWRINKSFLSTLKMQYGHREFSNRDAYEMYNLYHADHPNYRDRILQKYRQGEEIPEQLKREFDNLEWYENAPLDSWGKMNVRNHLSAAAFRGILYRLEPGVYCFTPEGMMMVPDIREE